MIINWIKIHLLSAVVFMPLLLGFILLLLPKKCNYLYKTITLLGTMVHALSTITSLLQIKPNSIGQIYTESSPWFTAVNIPVDYHLAVDGLNIWLVLLVVFLTLIIIISTYTSINRHTHSFVTLIFTLETGILGILVAQDLMIFYIFWNALQLPIFFLLTMWNDEDLKPKAIKFLLFTTFGSASCFVSMLAIAGEAGSFAIEIITQTITRMPINAQNNAFLVFVLIFAANLPLLSVYTKLPNTKIKTPITVFIVIIVVFLKLSSYGFIRFVLPMFSDMVEHYNQILAIISAMAVGYGALSAVTQTNSKKLIANLAISQMGITMLGISSMTTTGIQGALFQMFSSSISTSAMFFLLSALYRRANISNLIDFGKIALCMPIFTSLSLLAVICNIGIPFTNCFTGERMILSGILASSLSWRQFIVYIAITGIAINIICTLLLAKKIFWKSIISDQNTTWNHRLTDLTFKEIITIIPILVLSFWINSRPQTFLKQSELQINSLLTNSQIEPTIKSFSTALFTKLRH